MKDRFLYLLMLGFLTMPAMMTGFAPAQEPPRIVLVENSDGTGPDHYPLLISNKRGYQIRCQSQADDQAMLRGLGVISLPETKLNALDPAVIEAAPSDNPLLCPHAENYKINVFIFPGENGQELYLQFPRGFGSPDYPAKVYRPTCAGLIDALKIDRERAKKVDPRPVIGDENAHDIQCITGAPPVSEPNTLADWCMEANLDPAQETTVKELLELTPGGTAALGNQTACANAQAFLMANTTLDLAGKKLTSLEPLASLTGLTSLTLSDNQITDTRPLEKLTQLTFLDLSRNKISNITVLALMTKLVDADLSSNQIADLRPLASTRALTRLILANNKVTDVSPLRFLQELTALDLSTNQLTGSALTPLLGLAKLTTLDLSNNRVETMETINKFASTVTVKFAGNPATAGFTDLCLQHGGEQTPLGQTIRAMLKVVGTEKCAEATAALRSSPFLNLNGAQISDLQPIALFGNLATLNLANNDIADVSPLATMTGLTRLVLSANSIVDPDILLSLPNLEALDLTDNPLDRSRFFGACYARANLDAPQQAEIAALLKFAGKEDCLHAVRVLASATSGVSLEKLQLQSLNYFPVLQNVRRLDLRKNALRDAGPLRMLPHLMSLNVGGNGFTSLASLAPLTELEILDINGNSISSLEGIQALQKLQSLNLHGTNVSRIGLLGALPNLQAGKVMLGGLDITYDSFEDYCLVYKYDPPTLKDARPFMDAIKSLLASDGIDATDCKAVDAWARDRQVLNLRNGRIVSIAPVQSFTNLRELRLSGNRVRDVSPIAGLTGLSILGLSKNRIEDARPLAGLTALALLDLRGNRLNSSESVTDILRFKPALDDNPVCHNRPEQPTPLDREIVGNCNGEINEAEVTLTNVQTGKCLTIAGGTSTANNVPALQFDCDGHPSRRWTASRMGDVFQIQNMRTDKCLAIAEGRPVQFICDRNPSSQWKLVEADGNLQIENVQTGKCLTIEGASTANNVSALQSDCDSDPSRQWNVKIVGDE